MRHKLLKAFCCVLTFLLVCTGRSLYAQVIDSTPTTNPLILIQDSAKLAQAAKPAKKIRFYDPGKAALRSAILPGLGQIYNRKYWKVPIVYGALGTTAGIFIFNLQWYRRTRYAFNAVSDTNGQYPNVHPDLQYFVDNKDGQTLSYLRDQYRRDIDYSAVFFLIFWGLNVVDAAVDAHLKGFDVSPDLTMHVRPTLSQMAFTNGPALSLVFDVGKKKRDLVRARF
ncbi:DUF5683 domain-containing protein [Terrimonas sp. NA20]|uniref:DUF5683 domain-containing protein n=1 Tax=Terrimonas ginsenosidimutans TaxID=2908004 RepID=A0ABS9KTK8_9BACT|nr:DUF5683 domain-containing protein [Terrimonas ginsenosidimutans]MCG2615666.1 DUF5683 domain-containing protein [Terrimonas ginsenosidimutans]